MVTYPAPIRDRRLRIALAGCGRIAANHFAALAQRKDDVDLVAVCDVDSAALSKASELTGARGFASYAQMLAGSGAARVASGPAA